MRLRPAHLLAALAIAALSTVGCATDEVADDSSIPETESDPEPDPGAALPEEDPDPDAGPGTDPGSDQPPNTDSSGSTEELEGEETDGDRGWDHRGG